MENNNDTTLSAEELANIDLLCKQADRELFNMDRHFDVVHDFNREALQFIESRIEDYEKNYGSDGQKTRDTIEIFKYLVKVLRYTNR